MQFAGAIEYFQEEETTDSFGRVRAKWSAFDLDFVDITHDNFQNAIRDASNSENLLSGMKFLPTNAITGTGVLEMIDSVIQDKMLKNLKQTNDQQKPIKRRIRLF